MLWRTGIGFLCCVLVSACATSNERISYNRSLFQEPPVSMRGTEVYRLFWLASRRTPIAVIVSNRTGVGPMIELKTTDGHSTYRDGELNKNYRQAVSLTDLREFRQSFDGFSVSIPDDDYSILKPRKSDGGDVLVVCVHASSYSIEVKNPRLSHYISRSSCQDSFEADMKFVAPFIALADKHFNDELSNLFNFENYPLLQARTKITEDK